RVSFGKSLVVEETEIEPRINCRAVSSSEAETSRGIVRTRNGLQVGRENIGLTIGQRFDDVVRRPVLFEIGQQLRVIAESAADALFCRISASHLFVSAASSAEAGACACKLAGFFWRLICGEAENGSDRCAMSGAFGEIAHDLSNIADV